MVWPEKPLSVCFVSSSRQSQKDPKLARQVRWEKAQGKCVKARETEGRRPNNGFLGLSGRPKQFLDRNTKTENGTLEKPSYGQNQLIDQTISVLAKNCLFWPKQSLLAKQSILDKIVFDSVVH